MSTKEAAVATGKVTDIDVTWVCEEPTATSSGLRMTTIRVCHVSTCNGALIITDQNGVDHKFPMARKDRS